MGLLRLHPMTGQETDNEIQSEAFAGSGGLRQTTDGANLERLGSVEFSVSSQSDALFNHSGVGVETQEEFFFT